MGSYFRLSAVVLFALLAGCAQMQLGHLSPNRYERAVSYYENGRLSDAMVAAKSVSRDNPDYKAARKLIEDINSISMQLARRHMDIGEDFEKAGIYSKALEEYRESLKYNPSNILALKRIEVLSDALRSGDRPVQLEKKPRKSTKEDSPEDLANTHYLKGKIYLDSRAYAKAIEEFSAVLKIFPAYINTDDLLARAKKERDKAVDAHFRKGIAYFQSEEMEMAIKEWEAVLELDPSNKVAADYKDRAEVIMERLKRIREKQPASLDSPMCAACSTTPVPAN
jgi:tetratricopeptide (TPR) repeat protein